LYVVALGAEKSKGSVVFGESPGEHVVGLEGLRFQVLDEHSRIVELHEFLGHRHIDRVHGQQLHIVDFDSSAVS